MSALFFSLMGISSVILLILWMLIMQQLCNTRVTNKIRLYRITLLIIFSTFGLFNNALLYLSSISPNYELFWGAKLWHITYIIEPIALISGFHIFCVCQLAIMRNMYLPVNMLPPKYIQYSYIIIECIYIAAVFFCYICLFILYDLIFAQIFYIILTGFVLIQSLIACIIFLKLLKTLNNIYDNQFNDDKLTVAKHGVRIGIFLSISICIVCIFAICFAVQFVVKHSLFSFNHKLIDALFHSIFLITVTISLLLWIYKRSYFCVLQKQTVCDVCGCTDFVDFWCPCCVRKVVNGINSNIRKKRTVKYNDKTAVLLEESSKRTFTTMTSNGIDKEERNTNSKLTDYHSSMQQISAPTPETEHSTTDERKYVKS